MKNLETPGKTGRVDRYDVAMVLTQRRRGRRRWNVNLLSAMFLYGLWKVGIWNPESGMRNSQPFQRHLLEHIV